MHAFEMQAHKLASQVAGEIFWPDFPRSHWHVRQPSRSRGVCNFTASSILDAMSISEERVTAEQNSNINVRIASRVRCLRTELDLTLDTLAAQCGVSRSMLSLIERGESSPTAVVLEKIARGLGVALAVLFDDPDVPFIVHIGVY